MGKAKKEQRLLNFLREKRINAYLNGETKDVVPVKAPQEFKHEQYLREREKLRAEGLVRLENKIDAKLNTVSGKVLHDLRTVILLHINEISRKLKLKVMRKSEHAGMFIDDIEGFGKIEVTFFRKNSGAVYSGANLEGKSVASVGFDAQMFKCYFRHENVMREVIGCLDVDSRYMFEYWNAPTPLGKSAGLYKTVIVDGKKQRVKVGEDIMQEYSSYSVGNVAVSSYNKLAGKGSKTAGESYGKRYVLPKVEKPNGLKTPPVSHGSDEPMHKLTDVCRPANIWNS